MQEDIEKLVLAKGGNRISENSWQTAAPTRTISLKDLGQIIIEPQSDIILEGNYLSCSLPLGTITIEEAGEILANLTDLPSGEGSFVIKPENENIHLGLVCGFRVHEELETQTEAILQSLLDSLSDLVARTMLRADAASGEGESVLMAFLKKQAQDVIKLQAAAEDSLIAEITSGFAGNDQTVSEEATLEPAEEPVSPEATGEVPAVPVEEPAALEPAEEPVSPEATGEVPAVPVEEPAALEGAPVAPAEETNPLATFKPENPVESSRAESERWVNIIYTSDNAYFWAVYSKEGIGIPAPYWSTSDLRGLHLQLLVVGKWSAGALQITLISEKEEKLAETTDGQLSEDRFRELATPIVRDALNV